MTQPEQAVGGSGDTVIAAEPTIEDRFAALANDDPGPDPAPDDATTSTDDGEADAPELTADDVPEEGAEADDGEDADAPPIKPPVSWTAEEQEEFRSLPRTMQETLTRREAEREKFVQSKAQEAKQAHSKAESEAREAVLQIQQTYAQQLQALLPQVPERPSYQLQADDPWAWGQQMEAHEQALAQRQQAQQQLQQIGSQMNAAQEAARQQALQRETEALRQSLPEWFDETEGPKLRESVKSIGLDLGFSAEQLNDVTATEILALRRVSELKAKADKFDTLMAKKMETVRAAKDMPRVSKPGVPAGKGALANQRYTADRQAMKNGDREATTRVFKNFV